MTKHEYIFGYHEMAFDCHFLKFRWFLFKFYVTYSFFDVIQYKKRVSKRLRYIENQSSRLTGQTPLWVPDKKSSAAQRHLLLCFSVSILGIFPTLEKSGLNLLELF